MFSSPIVKLEEQNEDSHDQIDERVLHSDELSHQSQDSSERMRIKLDVNRLEYPDVQDGYLTYDMSEFHDILGENIDFDLDENDVDEIEESINQNDLTSPPQDPTIPRSSVHDQAHIPPKSYNVVQASAQRHISKSEILSNSQFYYGPPILEGDDIDPQIDMEMDVEIYSNRDGTPYQNSDDEDDDDLNLFDQLDDNLDNNNDPYRIMSRGSFEDFKINYETGRKANQIVLQNAQVLNLKQDEMEGFYPYLKALGFQRDLNILSIEDLINQHLLVNISCIEKLFENMRDFQQKWLEVSPTFTFSSQLQSFSLKLERFSEMVRFMLEYNAGKASGRRFQHGRSQFYFTDQQKVQKQGIGDSYSSKRFSYQQPALKDINVLQLGAGDESNESTQMCVALFKADELYNQFLQFLHIRRKSQKYSEILGGFDRIRSRFKMCQLMKPRQMRISLNLKPEFDATSMTYVTLLNDAQCKVVRPYCAQEFFNYGFNNKKLRGLRCNFLTESSIIVTDKYMRTQVLLYKAKLQSQKNKYSSHAYQQFSTNMVNDYKFAQY